MIRGWFRQERQNIRIFMLARNNLVGVNSLTSPVERKEEEIRNEQITRKSRAVLAQWLRKRGVKTEA